MSKCILLVFLLHSLLGQKLYGQMHADVSPNCDQVSKLNGIASRELELDVVEALLVSDQAIQISKQANCVQGKVVAQLIKANLLADLGQTKSALNIAKMATKSAASIPDDSLLAAAKNLWGFIIMTPLSGHESYRLFSSAYQINIKHGWEREQARNLLNMGIVNHWFLNNPALASKQLARCSTIAAKYKMNKLLGTLLDNWASILRQEGKSDEALVLLHKADSLNVAAGNIAGAIFNLKQTAMLHLAKRDIPKARFAANRALLLSQRIDLKSAEACANGVAASVSEAEGDYKMSYIFLKRHQVANDLMLADQSDQSLKFSKVSTDFERQKKENDLLKSTQDLQSQEVKFRNWLLILIGSLFVLSVAIVTILVTNIRKTRKLLDRLQLQNDAINDQNLKIEELNSILETKVETTSFMLTERTQQILDFASYNSHMVRGSLSRILGLAYIIKRTDELEEKLVLAQKMEESAFELDKAIKILNSKLEIAKTLQKDKVKF
jgi:hypothetical protein